MNDSTTPLDALRRELRGIARLGSASALLSWDQETLMPPRGIGVRAESCGEIGRLIHERRTSKAFGDLVAGAREFAESNGGDDDRRWTAVVAREYERSERLPSDLAEEYARASSETQEAWAKARSNSDFTEFAPALERIFEIRRRMGSAMADPGQSEYDALVEEYEPGGSAARIADVFATVEPDLVRLAKSLEEASRSARVDVLTRHYPKEAQATFGREIAKTLGFDFERGRIATSVHPFCMGVASPTDVRVTTRYEENDVRTATFGLIHEIGHALYEQGLDGDEWGAPRCAASSMAIHESQSRLWENFIGRSPEFWEAHYGRLSELFPDSLGDVSRDEFVRAIHRVAPSAIRVEADEVTYNLHIILRFGLEKQLFSGDVKPSELRDAWNARTEEVLGFTPESDAMGVLQDIHWSFGAFGYFPTYFLGNLYAAQFYASARKALPSLDDDVRNANFAPLLGWLRKNIHAVGSVKSADDICEEVTGAPLDGRHLVEFLESKFAKVHGG